MINERQLVLQYSDAESQIRILEEQLKDAKKVKDGYEQKLIEHLRGMDAKSTMKYEGVGHVTAVKPSLKASCNKGNAPELHEWLITQDRGELIKETVAASSLTKLIKENLEDGFPPPPFISYYFVESVKFYKAKEA